MPPPQVDPFAEFAVADADPFAAFVAPEAPTQPPQMLEPQGSGTGVVLPAKAAQWAGPAAIRTAGRFVANHPSGVQKTIGAGMTALGGTIGGGFGASVGGPTGAVVGALTGASVRGLTPTQASLREWGGRAAGESKDVAKQAGRAVGIQEYIKNTSGIKVKPSDILERPHGLPAAEKYAQSQGRDILKILGPDGNVVAGPTTPATAPKPRMGGRILSKAAKGVGAVGRAINAVSGPMAMTDFAQTVEPERRDIGVMGIGASQPTPQGAALEQLNARNIGAMQARQAQQAQQQQQIRDRILAILGMR